MSGMLSAIEARLARFADAVTRGREATVDQVQHGKRGESRKYQVPEEGKGKVVGVVVPAGLYVKLLRVRARLGTKTLQQTVMRVLEAGVTALGE